VLEPEIETFSKQQKKRRRQNQKKAAEIAAKLAKPRISLVTDITITAI
jgi:hypothetical protein